MYLVYLTSHLDRSSVLNWLHINKYDNDYLIVDDVDSLSDELFSELSDLIIFDYKLDITLIDKLRELEGVYQSLTVFVSDSKIGEAYLPVTENIQVLPKSLNLMVYLWQHPAFYLGNILNAEEVDEEVFSVDDFADIDTENEVLEFNTVIQDLGESDLASIKMLKVNKFSKEFYEKIKQVNSDKSAEVEDSSENELINITINDSENISDTDNIDYESHNDDNDTSYEHYIDDNDHESYIDDTDYELPNLKGLLKYKTATVLIEEALTKISNADIMEPIRVEETVEEESVSSISEESTINNIEEEYISSISEESTTDNIEEESTTDNIEEESTTDNIEEESTTDNIEEESTIDNIEEESIPIINNQPVEYKVKESATDNNINTIEEPIKSEIEEESISIIKEESIIDTNEEPKDESIIDTNEELKDKSVSLELVSSVSSEIVESKESIESISSEIVESKESIESIPSELRDTEARNEPVLPESNDELIKQILDDVPESSSNHDTPLEPAIKEEIVTIYEEYNEANKDSYDDVQVYEKQLTENTEIDDSINTDIHDDFKKVDDIMGVVNKSSMNSIVPTVKTDYKELSKYLRSMRKDMHESDSNSSENTETEKQDKREVTVLKGQQTYVAETTTKIRKVGITTVDAVNTQNQTRRGTLAGLRRRVMRTYNTAYDYFCDTYQHDKRLITEISKINEYVVKENQMGNNILLDRELYNNKLIDDDMYLNFMRDYLRRSVYSLEEVMRADVILGDFSRETCLDLRIIEVVSNNRNKRIILSNTVQDYVLTALYRKYENLELYVTLDKYIDMRLGVGG